MFFLDDCITSLVPIVHNQRWIFFHPKKPDRTNIFMSIQNFSILMIQVSLNRIEIFHYTRGYKNSGSDNIATTYHPSCLKKRGYPTLKNREEKT
jgi:hypothetical protein